MASHPAATTDSTWALDDEIESLPAHDHRTFSSSSRSRSSSSNAAIPPSYPSSSLGNGSHPGSVFKSDPDIIEELSLPTAQRLPYQYESKSPDTVSEYTEQGHSLDDPGWTPFERRVYQRFVHLHCSLFGNKEEQAMEDEDALPENERDDCQRDASDDFAKMAPATTRYRLWRSRNGKKKSTGNWTKRSVRYLNGATPPIIETHIKAWFPKIEAYFNRRLQPIVLRRAYITPLFLLAWLLGFAFLVRASYFNSSTNSTSSTGPPSWLTPDSTYWTRDDTCGLNGIYCEPFTNYSYTFRCPGQTLSVQLLNERIVSPNEYIFQPLVVGGMDDEATYRADSWICPAAIHHGLFSNREGGCGTVSLVGNFTNYIGGERNGVNSIYFASEFPSSFRFQDGVSQTDCKDLRDDILGFNVAMTTVYSFIIRPVPLAFYWALFCFGFWHVVLASDPSASPPDIATGFQYFLPAIFVGLAFWRYSWRWVLPAFSSSSSSSSSSLPSSVPSRARSTGAIMERTVWYLVGFWMGLLINVSLAWIPISRLTPADIKKEPGGLIAVIVIAVFLFFVILNQLRVIRRTGWFWFYLKWYLVGGVVLGILCALPGLEFRLHHYVAAMVLMPGCAFVTRPSALFQGFLLGMFLDGAGRWGFDSILQTPASLVGDGRMGTALPTFLTNSTNFGRTTTVLSWLDDLSDPAIVKDQWTGYALIIDDVLRYVGTTANYTLTQLSMDLPHYFRLAYRNDEGDSGDFTNVATAFFNNGTWVNNAPI